MIGPKVYFLSVLWNGGATAQELVSRGLFASERSARNAIARHRKKYPALFPPRIGDRGTKVERLRRLWAAGASAAEIAAECGYTSAKQASSAIAWWRKKYPWLFPRRRKPDSGPQSHNGKWLIGVENCRWMK